MLSIVKFPICNAYLPKRLNPLEPNEPSHPIIGIPANDVIRAIHDTMMQHSIHRINSLRQKKLLQQGLVSSEN